jgi:hypothetical protein
MDNWVQGLGLSAGPEVEQAWLAGLLPGLQEFPSG